MPVRAVLKIVISVVAFGLLTLQAHADTIHFTYEINCYNCGPIVGNGPLPLYTDADIVLTTTNIPVNGALTITGISGTRTTNFFMNQYSSTPTTSIITGLIPPDPTNPYGLVTQPDNLLYLTRDPRLDLQGLAYALSCCGGTYPDNIAQITGQFAGGYFELGVYVLGGITTVSFTPIPEPIPIRVFAFAAFAVFLWNRYRASRVRFR